MLLTGDRRPTAARRGVACTGDMQTSAIHDVTTFIEIIRSGSQVSSAMPTAQTSPHLIGIGSTDPTDPLCRVNTESMSYGFGVILLGPWITQTKSFAGSAVTSGSLSGKKLTVSVAMPTNQRRSATR